MVEKLAIEGGKPVRNTLLLGGTPFIGQEEIDAAIEVLKSGILVLTHGDKCLKLGEELAKYFGTKYGCVCMNGTTADHIALAALDIGPGDEVISPPLGMIATPFSILYQNAIPIFADVDLDYGMITPEDLRKKVTDKTRAIMVTHFLGHPADMGPILEIAEEKGIPVVEDIAQALGAIYKPSGKKVGSIGRINAGSMVWNKIITSGGEGGMVLTDDEELAERAISLINFGRGPQSEWPKATFKEFGWNFRMTEMQAAIGLVQLKKLDEFVEKRRRNAAYLTKHLEHLEDKGVKFPREPPWAERSVWWYYHVQVDKKELGIGPQEFQREINAENIGTYWTFKTPDNLWPPFINKVAYARGCPWSCPFYGREVNYEKMCPNAERFSENTMLLPCYPQLTKEDLDDMVAAIGKIVTIHYKRMH